MPDGFFTASALMSKAPPPLLPRCGQCGLLKTCKSPKMPVAGKGQRNILIIGEAPGADEDSQGVPFVGKTGQRLERTLRKLGVDMRRDCWLTNSLICRPEGNEIKNAKMIEWCRPNLIKTLDELKPEIIIPLGSHAVTSLLGHIWKEDVGGIMKWAGFRIPCQKPNAWICPAFHPSYVERSDDTRGNPAVALLWEKHLEAALDLRGRPWESIPDYESRIRKLYDQEEICRAVQVIMSPGTPIAFDYETNCLKPETEGSCIVSCALSNGTTTIAFPWQGQKVIEQMGIFLRSPLPKLGQNIKFEERWTAHEFGHAVNGWAHDCILGQHVIDCRGGITGFKFQAFVYLGAESYDDEVKPFLKPEKGKKINRILEEIDLPRLLLYNGCDALLEWEVAQKQREILGLEW